MPRRPPVIIERPTEIPLGDLRYSVTPTLVRSVAWAARSAGAIEGMRLSHFGRKRLEAEAKKLRIAQLVARAGHTVRLEEIEAVLAGAVLPPRKHILAMRIRQAAILCEAARYYAERGDPTTPETFATYLDFARHGHERAATLWSQFAGRPRERLLELHRGSVQVPEPVRRLYAWMDADDLVSDNGLLRAAVLHWGLSILFPRSYERPAIDTAINHELRAGRFDPYGLLVLAENPRGQEALSLRRDVVRAADDTGELTDLFNHFVHQVALAIGDLRGRLDRYHDREERLPWLMVRPPDELDRHIFEAIERSGSLTSPKILAALPEPRPPLRTLQRRLQRLVHDGLLVKHGARKDAYYRVAERF